MSPLISLFLFVLIDILGFSLVLPLFPYYTTEYGMSPVEIGLLQTSNAAAQFLAVPVLGSLSDKYGRRPLLIISVFGTLVSFIMLAMATSPTMLFASRIVDGLLGGNISLAQAYIAGSSFYHLFVCSLSLLSAPDDMTPLFLQTSPRTPTAQKEWDS
jgi:MFS transporter, DHA1 family, tetracycline resistance protein